MLFRKGLQMLSCNVVKPINMDKLPPRLKGKLEHYNNRDRDILAKEFSVSEAALTQLNKIQQELDNVYGFKISLGMGGCSGFNYEIDVVDRDPAQLDSPIYELEYNKIKFYFPYDSIALLSNLKLDYTREIFEQRFNFDSEDMKNKCACGISFNLKNPT